MAEDVKSKVAERSRAYWATVPEDQRSEKGRELAHHSKQWWDSHPEEAAKRVERARQLGKDHKWGALGESNGRAKLSAVTAKKLRDRFDAGDRLDDLAMAFGVSRSLVWLIGRRKIWKHL